MIMLLVLMPFFVGINHVAGRRIRQLSITMQERLGDLNGSLVERLTNIRVVQSFVRQGFEEQNVAHLNHRYYRETMRSVFVTETLSPTVELIAWIGMVAGIILAGNEVRTHQINLGSFMLFVLVAQKAGSQFKMLSRVNQLRQQTTGAGERIFDTLDIVPEIQNAPRAIVLPPVHGQVQFSQVNFHYRTGAEILHAIDVQVAPGEVIALVGPSGSGKTTLVNLLPRFYDPTAGSIRIDGQDLRDITLESLREQIGIVPQETLLFSGSIYENILYGRLTATEAEVIAAARSANALEFIERLPDGFQTVVGERGARLSGGQRQRVAIARALLKDPKILILDEATSALDTESEHLVQQALDRLMENRTTFVIAHRLSTVKGATRLLVLEHGRIVESGTHQELLELGGLYSRLYEMQFRPGTESLESV
jgi:subfamily B ATP-binding cassette protein MsbA